VVSKSNPSRPNSLSPSQHKLPLSPLWVYLWEVIFEVISRPTFRVPLYIFFSLVV
jgi:hypothetical protein